MHKNRRRQGDKAAGEEAVKRADNDDWCEAVRGDEAQGQNTRDQRTWNDHVHGSCSVRDKVGNDAAEDRAGVQDREEVEGHVIVRDVLLDSVCLNVEEDHVEPHEAKESAQNEEEIRELLESRKVKELAPGVRNSTDP